MSERLKSRYLRKREEINGHARGYFFAGFLFSFFLLFLFYQFRTMILKPTSACEDELQTYEVIETSDSAQSSYDFQQKNINQKTSIADIQINEILIKEYPANADNLSADNNSTDAQITEKIFRNEKFKSAKCNLMKPFKRKANPDTREASGQRENLSKQGDIK